MRAPAFWTIDLGPVIFKGAGKFAYDGEIPAMIRLAESGNAQAFRDITDKINEAMKRSETPDPRLMAFCVQMPKRYANNPKSLKISRGRGKPENPEVYETNLNLALEVRQRMVNGKSELDAIADTAENNKISERTVKDAYQLHRQDVKKILPDDPR